MTDPATVNLEQFLSTPRIDSYRAFTSYKNDIANRLYIWNHEVSSAFLGPLAIMEITLRNSINEQMTTLTGTSDWIKFPDTTTWKVNGNYCQLLPEDAERFKHVAERLLRQTEKYPNLSDIPSSQIVAGASLGDWVHLLEAGDPRSKKYNYQNNMWVPGLKKAFHNAGDTDRRKIHGEFDRLRAFRNRIAHHEPIHKRNLRYVIEDIISATKLISVEAGELIEDHHCVDDSLKSKEDALNGRGEIYI